MDITDSLSRLLSFRKGMKPYRVLMPVYCSPPVQWPVLMKLEINNILKEKLFIVNCCVKTVNQIKILK